MAYSRFLGTTENKRDLGSSLLQTQYDSATSSSEQITNEKMLWTDISPKKTYNWSTGTWKDLNVTDHEGNANQNQNDILFHTVKVNIIKIAVNNQCRWGFGGETLVHCWEECKRLSQKWNILWRFHKEIRHYKYHMNQQVHF